MAERTTVKAKRQEPPKAAGKAASKRAPGRAAASGGDGRLADENARLRAELASARERIADLERKQTDITNRIAWVIDSLHNLAD